MKLLKKFKRNLVDLREVWQGTHRLSLFKRIITTVWISNFYAPINDLYINFYAVPKERIQRIWAYLPLLWHVGEFDHAWHTKLWAFSLKRLYGIMDNGHHAFSEKKKRRMKTAIKCLERMSNPWESYITPHFEYIESTYGWVGGSFFEKGEQYKSDIQKKLYFEYMVFRDAKMYKQDFDLFVKILKKDLDSWWE